MKSNSVGHRLHQSFLENAEREAFPGMTYHGLSLVVEACRDLLRNRSKSGDCIGLPSKKTTATYAMWAACWMEDRAIVFLSSAAGSSALNEVLDVIKPVFVFNADDDLEPQKNLSLPLPTTAESTAYYIPTSGSTGHPKIIKVSHQSLNAWIDNSSPTWDIKNSDRVSQVFDLSFDPAISDFLWALLSGACLVPLDFLGQLDVGHWIRHNSISIWSSSPSLANALVIGAAVNPGSLTTLRRSTFIGEVLTKSFVQKWQRLAPKSEIENHYGPAECVISVSREKLDLNNLSDEILSVGSLYPGIESSIDAENLLTIWSLQVSDGYVNAPNNSFHFSATGKSYQTGDEVVFQSGRLKILGRKDLQIKINGQRWESEGIEALLQREIKTPICVLKWQESFFEGIDLVIMGSLPSDLDLSIENIFTNHLPASLRPRKIWLRLEAPLNVNGKLDRAHLKLEIAQGKLSLYGS